MADTSKITLGQLKTALTQAKNYTDNEIAGVAGISKVEPETSDIPKVFFNGDKPTNKTSVYATMEYVSKTEHFKAYVDIKCQGTSSMAYPKKNYTIKMFTDETMAVKLKKDFKGWGKQSKFCLKANYIDHSHARNVVSAKLWGQVVKSRSDFDTLPEELRTSPNFGAVDGFPIKVYYNNSYEGVYTWNIPKDGWMNNMDDKLDTHCILCGEEYVSGCFRSANASLWSDELHDVMPANIVTSFNNFQNFVINSSDDEFKTGLSTYADINSLIDYYIFQYVICGLDSMGKNQLFFTYDGIKWMASSYDMDSTFGMYWNGQSFVSATYRMQEDYESGKNTSSNYNGEGNLLYVRLEQIFINEIKARYAELRAGVLSYSNIVNEFERFMDTIGKDLYAEDLTIYTRIPSGNTNNIQQIRNYTRDRLAYVDEQIEALRELIPCTGIALSADTLSFTTTDTQTITATVQPTNTTDVVTWSASPTGVVIVDNGVVTPIANGDCTITVTCGSQTATCTVNVALPAVECTGISLDKTELKLSPGSGGALDYSRELTSNDLAYPTPNYNIDNSGNIIAEGSKADSYVTNPIDITNFAYISNIQVNGFGDYFNYVNIVFYDADMTFISKVAGESGKIPFGIVPTNVKYVRFSMFARGNAVSDNSLFNIKFNKLVNGKTRITIGANGYIQSSGSNANSLSEYYKVDGIQTVNLSGANWMSLVCYDENLRPVGKSSEIDGSSIYAGTLTTVEGTKYVQVCYYQLQSGVDKITLSIGESTLSPINFESSSGSMQYQLIATVTPTNCTQPVVWSVSPEGIVTVDNGLVTAVTNGEATVTATCGTQTATCAVTVSGISESGGGTEPINPNLVFQVNSASMNTADNTLTDNIAGISATLAGNPTVSGNQIAFTTSDTFSFDISSLNLTSSNRTFRIKFTPTTLDTNFRNIIGIGSSIDWANMTTSYIKSISLTIQHSSKGSFANSTVGSSMSSYNNNRLSANPVTGQEYELVISENIDGNVRWFIDGTLVQDGTNTLFNPLYLSNLEGSNRFIGSYSLIEIYNGYCNDYTEFTNMVNN